MTQHFHRRLSTWTTGAGLLLISLFCDLGGCSRPTPCTRLFEMQVKCSWSKQDPDRDTFVKECATTLGPLLDCAQHSDCQSYKACLTKVLEQHPEIIQRWRDLLHDCGLDTERHGSAR